MLFVIYLFVIIAVLTLPALPLPCAPCRCGLDVFEDEPAMKPGLADCKNAVIVPHIASASEWTRAGMVGRAAA